MLQVPGATSYMGCIGKDKFGEEMEKNCRAAGVNVSLILLFIFSFLCHLLLCTGHLKIQFLKLTYSLNDQVHYYEDENTPTGTCAVCVVGGERFDCQPLLQCFILIMKELEYLHFLMLFLNIICLQLNIY